MDALLIIDMQEEFLTKKGMFKDNFINSIPLVKNIKERIESIRSKGGLIVWITANYGVWTERPKAVKLKRPPGNKYKDVPLNNKFLCGAHWGKRSCCVDGTEGIFLHPELQAEVKDGDIEIIKHYFSSFTHTDLHKILQDNGVKRVIVTGIVANVCVLSTCTDAFFLGYDVIVPKSCISATSGRNFNHAIELIEKWYGNVVE